jgi:uncharacterized protein (DUF302 family)
MATKQITVQRFSVTSSKPFDDVVKALGAAVGHPDMRTFMSDVTSAKTYGDMERVIQSAAGAAGLMEFARFNLGEIHRKHRGDSAPRSLRFLIGNPLIMKQMLEHVPDAGSYAPVTILVDERPDGVRLSYDEMTSFLATHGSPEALKVARDLDMKIEAILTKAAA